MCMTMLTVSRATQLKGRCEGARNEVKALLMLSFVICYLYRIISVKSMTFKM